MSAVDPVSAVELAALVRRYLHDHHFTSSYVTFTAESQHLLTSLQSQSVPMMSLSGIINEYIKLKDRESRRSACDPLAKQMYALLDRHCLAAQSEEADAASAARPLSYPPSRARASSRPSTSAAGLTPAVGSAQAANSPSKHGRKRRAPKRRAPGLEARAEEDDPNMFLPLTELLNQPCVSGRGVSAMLDDESAPMRLAELINSQLVAGINAEVASATTALPAASAERSNDGMEVSNVLTSIVTSDPQLLESLITTHQPASNSNHGAGDEPLSLMDDMPFERDTPPPPSTGSHPPVGLAAEEPSARRSQATSDPPAPSSAPAFIPAAASVPAAAPAAASAAPPAAVALETPGATRADARTSTALPPPPPPPAAPAAPIAKSGSAPAMKIDPSTLTAKGIDLLLSGFNY